MLFNLSEVYLNKSCTKGNIISCVRLGDLYYKGYTDKETNTTYNYYDKALELYLHAYKFGNLESAYSLSYMYSNGFGVGIDYSLANKYLNELLENTENKNQYGNRMILILSKLRNSFWIKMEMFSRKSNVYL